MTSRRKRKKGNKGTWTCKTKERGKERRKNKQRRMKKESQKDREEKLSRNDAEVAAAGVLYFGI